MKEILVTGGAGYIGSHTCIELLNAGYNVVVLDNLSNSSEKAIQRVEKITKGSIQLYIADLLDISAIRKVFTRHKFDAVIHFAGLKAVGESVQKPLLYYQNNISGTLNLCEVMTEKGQKNIVFSSSATVYGDPAIIPISEECPVGKIKNPYGQTKAMLEKILTDIHNADSNWKIIILRYFNPIGAHKSGLIGENPKGIPNNLLPYISQVAVGKLKELQIYGNNYKTNDGTGVRDYIHVVDLAKGHVKALERFFKSDLNWKNKKDYVEIYNLGTGNGYSVMDVVKAFQKVSGKKIPYRIASRRPGDIANCYANVTKAKEILGWVAEKGLIEMCEDAWRWQNMNPDGY